MRIEKFSSQYNILDAGSIITFDTDSDLTFSISMDESFEFKVVMLFPLIDGSRREIRSEVNGNVITIRCVNFIESMGIGNTKPIELATFQDRKVYLSFRVYYWDNNSGRKVSYTFYMDNQVTSGSEE